MSASAAHRDPAGVPRCDCGTPLKPDVVLFGELLPADALARAEDLAAGADLLLCIGSSLEVHPVAQLPATTLASGGSIAVMTVGPTPYDSRAAIRCGGDVVAELTARHRRAGSRLSATARARSAASTRSSVERTSSSCSGEGTRAERRLRGGPHQPRAARAGRRRVRTTRALAGSRPSSATAASSVTSS